VSTGAVVWITGLPSSGKSTFARAARDRLESAKIPCIVLDGDRVRAALVPPPGYDGAERDRFYATLANLAVLLAEQGLVVLVAATAHRRTYRNLARNGLTRYLEVWIDVPLAECRRRDSKGLYAAFADRRASDVPGEDLAYEPPTAPDVVGLGGNDQAALERLLETLAAPSPDEAES
jgi:adenylylsulfate kinase